MDRSLIKGDRAESLFYLEYNCIRSLPTIVRNGGVEAYLRLIRWSKRVRRGCACKEITRRDGEWGDDAEQGFLLLYFTLVTQSR